MTAATFKPDPEELLFLPLGGSDEIGMNLNLYHYDGKWLMVDLGVTFGDETAPGIDVVMPDPGFIERRRDDLLGLIVTHGHEDHIGAIPYLWQRLRCPIYATPFAASLIRRKLAEAKLLHEVELHLMQPSDNFEIGPFRVELIGLTHSIPEPNAIALRCRAGTILHTGDWKFDPDPKIGEVSDLAALEALAQEGVLAMVGDSTNADVPGRTGSEAELGPAFEQIFADSPGRVAVTCFASNVARLHTVTLAARQAGRDVALVGRSLWRMYEAAQENGYLLDLPDFLTEDDAGFIPASKLAIICTGSQGEQQAALARIADGSHPRVALEAGDTVVFSSREIPGNEKNISRIQSKLLARRVEVITEREQHVHVSGHPARDDLVEMYQIIRPEIAIPVHGELRHLAAHAAIARDCQTPQVVIPGNGGVLRLAPGPAEIIDWVDVRNLAVDGPRLRHLNSEAIRDRKKLLHNGSVAATVVVNHAGRVRDDPILSVTGLYGAEDAGDFNADLVDLVRDTVEDMPTRQRKSNDAVAEAARRAIRRMMRAEFGKRPMTTVHVIRA